MWTSASDPGRRPVQAGELLELLADEHDGKLSGERPDLLEELDKRSLGLGHEPESTTETTRLASLRTEAAA